jgi:hypothetical protein
MDTNEHESNSFFRAQQNLTCLLRVLSFKDSRSAAGDNASRNAISEPMSQTCNLLT